MSRAPTTFQSEALCRAAAVGESAGVLNPPEKEWIEGKEEGYGKLTWRLSPATTLEAYVYTDEAGVMVNQEWTVFEEPDYRTQQDLLNAFVSHLQNVLRYATEMRGSTAAG
jgi:hypothetical protein